MSTDPRNKTEQMPEGPPPPYPGSPTQEAAYPSTGAYLPEYAAACATVYQPGTYPPAPPEGSYEYAAPPPPYHLAQGLKGQARPYVAPALVVTTQPVAGDSVFITRTPQPSSYLALSIVTCLCFSPFCGLIAICFSVMSQNSYLAGDSDGAKRNGQMALALSVAGIVLSVAMLIVLFSSGQTHLTT